MEKPISEATQKKADELLEYIGQHRIGKLSDFELKFAVLLPALMGEQVKNKEYFTGYDPIQEEFKKFSILEFQHNVLAELTQFCQQMKEAGENPCNEAQKVTHRTYTEWMNSFRMWASW